MPQYFGYKEIELSEQEIADLYNGKPSNNFGLIENEYLIIKNSAKEVVDYFRFIDGQLKRVNFHQLGDNFTGILKPRNPEQYIAFDMLKDNRTTIKLVTGCFGSGKTLSLVTAALESIDKGNFEKIIWVRNNVQVKDTDQIGSLPGTELDKMLPYVMPMADHCGGIEGLKSLMTLEKLEVIPLAFLRGRSIRNSIIISSEAENLTKEHIQLLIGRVDEGSNLWMDADLKQRDRAVFEKSAGIETMIDRLKDNQLFGYVHLPKTERSATARLADLLDG